MVEGNKDTSGDIVPRPDPTVATNDALERGLAAERDYVDGQISVIDERLKGIEKATRVLHDATTQWPTDIDLAITHLRELAFERMSAIIQKVDAVQEQVEAVLTEQRLAMGVASEEREKSARALRAELARSIEEGDRNLREHIEQQVHQIRAALVAAETLELQRFDSAREQTALTHDASERAIAKAETANEKRFEEQEQWRTQTIERERAQQQALAAQLGTFMPREVAEAQIADLRRLLDDLSGRLSKIA